MARDGGRRQKSEGMKEISFLSLSWSFGKIQCRVLPFFRFVNHISHSMIGRNDFLTRSCKGHQWKSDGRVTFSGKGTMDSQDCSLHHKDYIGVQVGGRENSEQK